MFDRSLPLLHQCECKLGSVLSEINWAAGGASVQANQLFGPYGNTRYNAGTLNTAKGFTGQYNDQLTGLDYFNARYYDPVAGVFLSADPVQGNASGMNPYGYVGGNPETYADPSGQMYIPNYGGPSEGAGIVSKVYYSPPAAQVFTPQDSCGSGGYQLNCSWAAYAGQARARGTITYRIPVETPPLGGFCVRASLGLEGGIGIAVGGCGGASSLPGGASV